MKYTTFAKTDIQLSKLSFGAMGLNCAFGNYEETDLIKSIHHSLDQGVNVIDTARAYMDSEVIVGKALKQWKGEKPFIASKAIPAEAKDNAGWGIPNPATVAYPKGAVRKSVETSLQKLDIETIDLLQLHQFWGQFHGEGTWMEELQALKQEGKINHIGVSIVDHRHDGALALVQSGLIDSVQTIINIFDPLAFDSLIPDICRCRLQVTLILFVSILTNRTTIYHSKISGSFNHVVFWQKNLSNFIDHLWSLWP